MQGTTGSYADYERCVLQSLWTWADRRHGGELDGGRREGRPPVFAVEHALKNVLVPVDVAVACRIREAASQIQWHRWFGSLRSSQALTFSVFGAIRAFGRLDVLEGVKAECGRPAFGDDSCEMVMDIEYEVRTLEEPRPTSVDVLLRGRHARVAVECKFTERAFSTCSRPKQKPVAPNYCDGSYRVQHGRRTRCALTEQGIRYWEHLPHLFDWPADCDHSPCPFGSSYQLGRNLMAAMEDIDMTTEVPTSHALVIYDARNPEFFGNGKAAQQWETAAGACRTDGLLRRVTWQRLLGTLARIHEFGYLTDGLEAKYGLKPS